MLGLKSDEQIDHYLKWIIDYEWVEYLVSKKCIIWPWSVESNLWSLTHYTLPLHATWKLRVWIPFDVESDSSPVWSEDHVKLGMLLVKFMPISK